MKRKHACRLALALAIVVAALPAWAQQKYNEPPMLAEMVANGELPPVEERLPPNPFVRQVNSEIGTYGGTLNKWDTNLRNAFFTLYGYVFNTEMGGYGFDTPFDVNSYLENGMFFTGHEPVPLRAVRIQRRLHRGHLLAARRAEVVRRPSVHGGRHSLELERDLHQSQRLESSRTTGPRSTAAAR